MERKLLLTIFYLFGILTAYSQGNSKIFEKGYLVTTEGDTLHGYIQAKGKIRIKPYLSSQKIKKISYKKIKAYHTKNSEYIVINKLTYKILNKGFITLYLRKDYNYNPYVKPEHDFYYIQKKGDKKLTLLSSSLISKKAFRKKAVLIFASNEKLCR
ncbi:hypothetical protein, partial [Xanthovirga aplysinae]|uniref:hypothetical protein n=1 Tax=Xanthovirga aplysinae TaxID=2529853 RepID=UPI0012BC6C78